MTVEIFLRKMKSIRNELACDPYYKAKNEYITGLVDMADVTIRILEGEEEMIKTACFCDVCDSKAEEKVYDSALVLKNRLIEMPNIERETVEILFRYLNLDKDDNTLSEMNICEDCFDSIRNSVRNFRDARILPLKQDARIMRGGGKIERYKG